LSICLCVLSICPQAYLRNPELRVRSLPIFFTHVTHGGGPVVLCFFNAVTTQLVASWCFSMYERCYHLAVTHRIIHTRARTMCVRLQLSPSGEVNMAYVPTSTSVPAAGGFIPTQSLVPDGLSRRPSATHPPVFVSPSLHYVLRHICIAFHVYFV